MKLKCVDGPCEGEEFDPRNSSRLSVMMAGTERIYWHNGELLDGGQMQTAVYAVHYDHLVFYGFDEPAQRDGVLVFERDAMRARLGEVLVPVRLAAGYSNHRTVAMSREEYDAMMERIAEVEEAKA